MVIQTSGSISFSQLRTEFVGGSSAISFSSLYQDNASKNTIATDGIPNTGSAINVGVFYGKAKVQNYNNLVLLLDAKNTASYPGSGATWTDLSTRGNTMTLNNNSYTSTGGGAVTFNGSTSYLFRSTFNGMNSSNWSLIYWFYVSSAGGCVAQLNRDGVNANQEFMLFMNSFWDWQNSYGFNTTPLTSVTNAGWYQIGFVKNGTTGYWYLNGAANGTATGAQNVQYGSASFCIGKDYRDNTNFLNGYLGLIHMYNYSLATSEVSTNFTNYRGRYGI